MDALCAGEYRLGCLPLLGSLYTFVVIDKSLTGNVFGGGGGGGLTVDNMYVLLRMVCWKMGISGSPSERHRCYPEDFVRTSVLRSNKNLRSVRDTI